MTVLSGMAAPAVSDYVEDAKLVRARSDVHTLADGIVESPFEQDGLPSTGDDIVAVVSPSGMGR